MDMQQLLYFIEVAKEKHMTNAAKKLYISQPALSTSIARLEKELGVPLFIRNRRHIVLSDSGKIFLLFAQNTCEQYRETVERLSALNAERNYTIRFGSSSQRSLSDNLGDFPEKNPHLKIIYCNNTPEALAQMLLEDKLDLCVTSPPINCSGIHTDIICEEEIFIGTSKHGKYAQRKSIRLAELKEESFIMLNSDYHFKSLCEGFCHQAGFYPNNAFEVNYSTMREINRSGSLEQHVTFVPKSYCSAKFASEENRVFLRVEDVHCARLVGLSRREGKAINAPLSALINCVNESYKEW